MWHRDSSVGIATGYGLDGPWIESRCGARFSAPVQNGSEAHPASCAVGTGSFPGVKWPWRGVDHPPPSRAEVNERVELYTYSLSLGLLGLFIYVVHSVVFLKLLKRYKQSNTTHQLFVKHTKTATCFGFIN
jgi:hypothetical protein